MASELERSTSEQRKPLLPPGKRGGKGYARTTISIIPDNGRALVLRVAASPGCPDAPGSRKSRLLPPNGLCSSSMDPARHGRDGSLSGVGHLPLQRWICLPGFLPRQEAAQYARILRALPQASTKFHGETLGLRDPAGRPGENEGEVLRSPAQRLTEVGIMGQSGRAHAADFRTEAQQPITSFGRLKQAPGQGRSNPEAEAWHRKGRG